MPVFLLPILAFLKAHWRALALVGLVLGAFVSGRCSAPKPTVRTVVQTQVQWKDRVVTQTVEKQAEKRDEVKTLVVYRDRITHKDGTVEDKSETHEQVGDETTRTADTTTAKTEDRSGSKVQVITQTITSDAPKRWNVDVGFGAPISLKPPFFSSPFFMADVSRQVLGPFSLGLWGTLDVRGRNPALGLSIGVGF